MLRLFESTSLHTHDVSLDGLASWHFYGPTRDLTLVFEGDRRETVELPEMERVDARRFFEELERRAPGHESY